VRWRESVEPVRMARVAVVAPAGRLDAVLGAVARTGSIQLEQVPPDASLAEAEAEALHRHAVAGLVGWSPRAAVAPLHAQLAALGGAVVRLPSPRGAQPPTMVSTRGASATFQPLVDTYATVPYADLNPSLFAGPVYILMFGMMFGDVGHGALLLAAGLLLLAGHPRSLSRHSHLAPFVIGAGMAAMVFGFLYGEAFGPTNLVPTLWTSPLDHPTALLAVGIAGGAVLLAAAYALGSVNRWREGGPSQALVATTGLAGTAVYLGLGASILGWYKHATPVLVAGACVALVGAVLGFLGCYARTGGVLQSGIELFDSVLRMGTNTVSFARLAAFGLTHAALEQVVWSGSDGLLHRGAALWAVAVVVLVAGNVLAFALEGLVAGIQALRLDYYELFSRIFVSEGEPFRPWHVGPPAVPSSPISRISVETLDPFKEDACSRG
jgi:V/A-type H+/Na+-transporting ATPase subunit I